MPPTVIRLGRAAADAIGPYPRLKMGVRRRPGEQLPVAELIILLLCLGQFNSIRLTAIIVQTIPLELIGVVPTLYSLFFRVRFDRYGD